ncbi:hypothetical protein GCM10011505_11290 [Tistrella bauzanensis]|uniref:Uncharacterized protein n=1 Tax=Tistrella bauzanensis TaxID=657419 RepID=A0ABQ1IB92_9PROT|nr:hypothetical protein GCM10011505_11290 [Tistrella bauzanensis]
MKLGHGKAPVLEDLDRFLTDRAGGADDTDPHGMCSLGFERVGNDARGSGRVSEMMPASRICKRRAR